MMKNAPSAARIAKCFLIAIPVIATIAATCVAPKGKYYIFLIPRATEAVKTADFFAMRYLTALKISARADALYADL